MKVVTAIVRGLIALLFIYYLVAFIWSVAGRIGYPYELEYYEGSTYLHTQRLIEGKQLYVSPDEGFIPYPYTPLYYAAVIPFTWIAGQNIIAGRLASLVSLAFIGWFIWHALYQSTKSKLAGLFAFGMFLSLYYISGGWLDVCRIDIFLCFTFVGTVFFLKDFPEKRWGLLPSAAFLIASIYTKQVGIVFLIFIFPFLYTRARKHACIYFLGVLASIAVIAGILNAVSDGWFLHYIYQVPQHRQFELQRFYNIFLLQDIPGKMPILLIGSILWVFVRNVFAGKRTPLNIWEWTLPAAFLASAMPRSQPGGYENNLLPLMLWCSIMFGFFLYHLPIYFDRLLLSAGTKEAKRQWTMWRLIAYNFLLAQLILVFYIPTANGFPRKADFSILPTAADRLAGDRLMSYLHLFPGEVYLPTHNYYGWKAGKTPNLIITAAIEHLKARGEQPGLIYDQLNNQVFDAIIINNQIPPRRQAYSYERAIIDNYYWAGNIPYESHQTFYPTTGLWTRPDIVMLPLEILKGIEGDITAPPVSVNRGGDLLLACSTNAGRLFFIDPDEFTVSESIPLPFNEAVLIGTTNDDRIALMTPDSICLIGGFRNWETVPLPAMEYPPAGFQAAIDPFGEFAVVADNSTGSLVVVDIPSGRDLGRLHVGSPIGRVLIAPDGGKLYVTVGESLSPLYAGDPNFASLYRYDIVRKTEGVVLQLAWTVNWPHHGRELRLSPDGNMLYWFDPMAASPIGVFSAESPKLLRTLKARSWRVRDIAFGDEAGEIYVHYSVADYNGVAILDAENDVDYGRARLYDRTGWIVPRSDTEGAILFSVGTNRVTRFRIYPKNSWPGEQGFGLE